MKGKIPPPNYTQIPNALFALMPEMSECEMKVTFAIARETFGWHRKSKKFSFNDLVPLTGLARRSVINGIEAGLERGTILRSPDGDSFRYYLHIEEKPCTENPSTVKSEVVQNLHQPSAKSAPPLVQNLHQQQPSTPLDSDSSSVLNKELNKTIKEKTLPKGKGSEPLQAEKDPAKTPKKEKEKDVRASHPAITAVRKFLPDNRFPNKLTWDEIIQSLGENPDLAKLELCAKAWATISKNMYNLTWALEWYQTGIPEKVKANIKHPSASSSSGFGVIPGTNVIYRRRQAEA